MEESVKEMLELVIPAGKPRRQQYKHLSLWTCLGIGNWHFGVIKSGQTDRCQCRLYWDWFLFSHSLSFSSIAFPFPLNHMKLLVFFSPRIKYDGTSSLKSPGSKVFWKPLIPLCRRCRETIASEVCTSTYSDIICSFSLFFIHTANLCEEPRLNHLSLFLKEEG